MINKIKEVKVAVIATGATVVAGGIMSALVVRAAKKNTKKISKEAQEMVMQDKTVELLEKLNENIEKMTKEMEGVKDNVNKVAKETESIKHNTKKKN